MQIQPKAIICEIQPVTIEDEKSIHSDIDDVKEPLNLVKIGDDISEHQKQQGMDLLEKYRDVFFYLRYRYWTHYDGEAQDRVDR